MNNSEIGNNSSSSSNASVDAYLASIRNRKNKKNNESNKIKIEIEEEEEDENAINRKIVENIKALRQKKRRKKKKCRKTNDTDKINEQTEKNKHSLFDPEKYNKKNHLTEQQEKWLLPPKKKPQKEIDEMVNRLSKPSPRLDFQIQDDLNKKKEPVNPQIFDRLYEMSTEKEKKNQEKRIQQEKNNSLLHSSPKSNSKSQLLAEKMLFRFVDNCFNAFPKSSTIKTSQDLINDDSKSSKQSEEGKDENKSDNNNENNESKTNISGSLISDINENNDCYFKNVLSQEELDDLLILLGLRSRRENLPKFNKILFEKMNDWVLQEKQDGSRTYDAIKIHNEMIHVIKEGEFSFSSFDRFARQRIIIALSNSKQFSNLSKSSIYSNNTETLIKPSNESLDCNDENEFNSSKSIQYKSIIRLSQSKRKNCESPRKNKKDDDIHFLSIRPRPKFMMNPYSEELEPASISAKTEKIFKKSEVANIPFVEREEFFTEKRRKLIEKMSEESNKSQLMKFEHKPKFSNATRQELNEYKEKKERMKKAQNEQTTNRTKTMNYEVYKKTIHKEMTEKKVRPKGWDNDITRHRIAYQKYLQEKKAKEKNKEQEYDMMNELDIVSKYKL